MTTREIISQLLRYQSYFLKDVYKRQAREEMRELMVHRKNLSLILQGDAREGKGKEAEREGR